MRLKRVQISNYRSIERATIEFEPRCRILIGKNEAGKTNLLSACALIDPEAKVAQTDLRETRDQEEPVKSGYVRFIFDLSTSEMLDLRKKLREKFFTGSAPIVKIDGKLLTADEYFATFQQWIHAVSIPSGNRSNTYWSKAEYKLEPGWLLPKAGLSEDILVKLNSVKHVKLGDIAFLHESRLEPQAKGYFEAANASQISKHFALLVNDYAETRLPRCLNWKYSDSNLLPPSIDIETFKQNPPSCEPLRAMFLLAGESDPTDAIAKAQQSPKGLRNLLTRVARATNVHIKGRWKELGAIEIILSPNGSQIDAAVQDAHNSYSFEQRSDGFKRYVSFLILVSARSIAKDFSEVIFIQDEPDLGLHPTGIKSLLNELIELSRSNYVLISSHSIFMVDKERIDRHLIVTKQGESTSLSGVDRSQVQDEEVLFNALGYSIFELVRPLNVVFEGWRDKKLFSTQLRKKGGPEKYLKSKLKNDIGLTHALGLKDIPKVVNYFDAIERSSFVISDSDAVALEKQRQMAQEKPAQKWKRYDELLGTPAVYTAEDFVKPTKLRSALAAVLNDLGMEGDIPVADLTYPVEGGVVAKVSQFLVDQGVPQDEKKAALNNWKSYIFDQLEPDDIELQYASVIEAVAVDLGFVKPDP